MEGQAPFLSSHHAVLASIVHIAREVWIAAQANSNVESQDIQGRTGVWGLLGLTPDECSKLCEGVGEKVGEISSQIFPETKIVYGNTP